MKLSVRVLCVTAVASNTYCGIDRSTHHEARAESPPARIPMSTMRVEATVPAGMMHGSLLPEPTVAAPDPGEFPAWVEAIELDAPIHRKAGAGASVVGYARPGVPLPASAPVSRSGCKDGAWHEVWGRGFVCTAKKFRLLGSDAGADGGDAISVATDSLPTRYAQITDKDAPRYTRVPTIEEVEQAERARTRGKAPGVVEQYMDGDYYIAVLDEVEDGGRRFYRTVRGAYIAVEDAEIMPVPTLMGEPLEEGELPLAFVYHDDVKALCPGRGGAYEPCGVVDKFARFSIAREMEHDGDTLLVSDDGFAVRAEHSRVIRAIERPDGIAAGAKWIHVDLAEQAVIAYEGDTPIFASLVSSGREGYETPTGLYKVMRKYGSKTMKGEDDVDGVYDVEEVPWALYYHRGYALHGAYWHNIFGNTKSHGCTNIAPADAHFLFWWSDPDMPPGWHGLRYRSGGTRIYLTDDSAR